MPQVFHRSFNVISKVSVFGALIFVVALGWVSAKTVRSPYYTNAFVAVEQPVLFSHQHHAGVLGIDCRYCHSTAETSAFAGMPTSKTCMNCHSQIWVGSDVLAPVRDSYRTGTSIEWNRVHRLPDFVMFDHSIHVQKGIGCVSCHGRVDEMPLTWQVHSLHMDWCLDCHRHPERHVRPREHVFAMAWQPGPKDDSPEKLIAEHHIRSKTSCSVCHR
jgi:hypothetical protein